MNKQLLLLVSFAVGSCLASNGEKTLERKRTLESEMFENSAQKKVAFEKIKTFIEEQAKSVEKQKETKRIAITVPKLLKNFEESEKIIKIAGKGAIFRYNNDMTVERIDDSLNSEPNTNTNKQSDSGKNRTPFTDSDIISKQIDSDSNLRPHTINKDTNEKCDTEQNRISFTAEPLKKTSLNQKETKLEINFLYELIQSLAPTNKKDM